MVMRESELQLAISYYLLERERERERERETNLKKLKVLCKETEKSRLAYIELEILKTIMYNRLKLNVEFYLKLRILKN